MRPRLRRGSETVDLETACAPRSSPHARGYLSSTLRGFRSKSPASDGAVGPSRGLTHALAVPCDFAAIRVHVVPQTPIHHWYILHRACQRQVRRFPNRPTDSTVSNIRTRCPGAGDTPRSGPACCETAIRARTAAVRGLGTSPNVFAPNSRRVRGGQAQPCYSAYTFVPLRRFANSHAATAS